MATTVTFEQRSEQQPVLPAGVCCQNYAPIYDPMENEIICQSCGAVNSTETELAKELYDEISDAAMRTTTMTDHMMSLSGLLVENGTDHAFRSHKSKGLCNMLGSPTTRARDINHKKFKPILKDGYNVGSSIERNGFFYQDEEGKTKYKISYTRDKLYIQVMQLLFQLSQTRGRDDYARARAGKQLKRLFSILVFQNLPKLLAEIADYKANASESSSKDRAESRERIYSHVNILRETLVEILKPLQQEE